MLVVVVLAAFAGHTLNVTVAAWMFAALYGMTAISVLLTGVTATEFGYCALTGAK